MLRALNASIFSARRSFRTIRQPLLSLTLHKAKYSITTTKKYEDLFFKSTHNTEKYWSDIATSPDSIAWYNQRSFVPKFQRGIILVSFVYNLLSY